MKYEWRLQMSIFMQFIIIKSLRPSDAYMRRQHMPSFIQMIIHFGSDNGLAPSRRQIIIRTNAGLLLNGPLGTNFSEILFYIQTFVFKKMHFKMLQFLQNSSHFVSASMC